MFFPEEFFLYFLFSLEAAFLLAVLAPLMLSFFLDLDLKIFIAFAPSTVADDYFSALQDFLPSKHIEFDFFFNGNIWMLHKNE